MVLLVTAKPFQSTIHHPNNLLNGFWEELLINWQEWATLTFVYCTMSVGLVGLDQKRNHLKKHRGANFSCPLHGQNIAIIHTVKADWNWGHAVAVWDSVLSSCCPSWFPLHQAESSPVQLLYSTLRAEMGPAVLLHWAEQMGFSLKHHGPSPL